MPGATSIMDELLWVTTRGRSRHRLHCATDALTPFLCTAVGKGDKSADRILFAALSVGLTPEVVPRIASIELAVAASPEDTVITLPVDPYGCTLADGAQTPGIDSLVNLNTDLVRIS